MDLNATDPSLLALVALRSGTPEALEWSRVSILGAYLKRFGKTRLFVMLQNEHERKRLNERVATIMLALIFVSTWMLRTIVNLLAQHRLNYRLLYCWIERGGQQWSSLITHLTVQLSCLWLTFLALTSRLWRNVCLLFRSNRRR